LNQPGEPANRAFFTATHNNTHVIEDEYTALYTTATTTTTTNNNKKAVLSQR